MRRVRDSSRRTRRDLLVALGGAGSVLLAGCLDDGSGDGPDDAELDEARRRGTGRGPTTRNWTRPDDAELDET